MLTINASDQTFSRCAQRPLLPLGLPKFLVLAAGSSVSQFASLPRSWTHVKTGDTADPLALRDNAAIKAWHAMTAAYAGGAAGVIDTASTLSNKDFEAAWKEV